VRADTAQKYRLKALILRVSLLYMSANVEKAVEKVLKLAAGYGETVVAFAEGDPVRLDLWACNMWSSDRSVGDVAVGLWLRHVLSRYLGREVVESVVSTGVYRAMKETIEEVGVAGGPDMEYEELHFELAELRLRGTYGRRAVYELKPFGCHIKATAVRVYVPTWILCPQEDRENCRKRAKLTEKLRKRGINIEDVVRGTYVPVDVSELESFLRRIL
jgi:hypothetical protein